MFTSILIQKHTWRIITVASVWFVISAGIGRAQGTVTIDFNYPYFIQTGTKPANLGFPWVEDGYTMRGSLGASIVLLNGNAGSPPYPGALRIDSLNFMSSVVTITNNSATPFDRS